jgi:hypothetical protein
MLGNVAEMTSQNTSQAVQDLTNAAYGEDQTAIENLLKERQKQYADLQTFIETGELPEGMTEAQFAQSLGQYADQETYGLTLQDLIDQDAFDLSDAPPEYIQQVMNAQDAARLEALARLAGQEPLDYDALEGFGSFDELNDLATFDTEKVDAILAEKAAEAEQRQKALDDLQQYQEAVALYQQLLPYAQSNALALPGAAGTVNQALDQQSFQNAIDGAFGEGTYARAVELGLIDYRPVYGAQQATLGDFFVLDNPFANDNYGNPFGGSQELPVGTEGLPEDTNALDGMYDAWLTYANSQADISNRMTQEEFYNQYIDNLIAEAQAALLPSTQGFGGTQ